MKRLINVVATFDTEGNIKPNRIIWDDFLTFEIDSITDIRRAASLKAGGTGIRYTCRIHGQTKYIFLDNGVWFVNI